MALEIRNYLRMERGERNWPLLAEQKVQNYLYIGKGEGLAALGGTQILQLSAYRPALFVEKGDAFIDDVFDGTELGRGEFFEFVGKEQ